MYRNRGGFSYGFSLLSNFNYSKLVHRPYIGSRILLCLPHRDICIQTTTSYSCRGSLSERRLKVSVQARPDLILLCGAGWLQSSLGIDERAR